LNTVESFLKEKASKTEQAITIYLNEWNHVPPDLKAAAEYSLFAGGKRLRPALTLGAAELITGDDTIALPAACALEMIHTYSLIHDDLPAMDNDDLRRGKPTLHKAFNEALAILTGDALLTMAFDIIARTDNPTVVRELAYAAGAPGMVGGQVLDMMYEGRHADLDTLRHIHACKTGALIRVSIRCGAILAGATPSELTALSQYGEQIGLAFQIADDILDIVGSEKNLGKKTGSDLAKDKSTYPALLGIEAARQLGHDAMNAAINALSGFGPQANTFRELAHFIIERGH